MELDMIKGPTMIKSLTTIKSLTVVKGLTMSAEVNIKFSQLNVASSTTGNACQLPRLRIK